MLVLHVTCVQVSHLSHTTPDPLCSHGVIPIYVERIVADAEAPTRTSFVFRNSSTSLRVSTSPSTGAEDRSTTRGHPRVLGRVNWVPAPAHIVVHTFQQEAIDPVPYCEGISVEIRNGGKQRIEGGLLLFRDEGPVGEPHHREVLTDTDTTRPQPVLPIWIEPSWRPNHVPMTRHEKGAKSKTNSKGKRKARHHNSL